MKIEKEIESMYYDWKEIETLVTKTVNKTKLFNKKYSTVLGIKNGGIIPARLMANELKIEKIEFISIKQKQKSINESHLLQKNEKYLIVDEILDTGRTYNRIHNLLRDLDYDFAVLLSRYKPENNKIISGEILNHKKWIIFPWENKDRSI